MNKKIPDKKDIKSCKTEKVWDLGNKVLYDLCEKYPRHKKDEEIIAKVWLIGRSYATAIERRHGKKDKKINDDFYKEDVTKIFRESDIDDHLKKLMKYKIITEENLLESLKAHYYLMEKIRKITDDKKRSFCSKYLHFHLPDLFFIFDSRAVGTLGKFINKSEYKKYTKIWKKKEVDEEYAKFSCKCFTLKNKIKHEYGDDLKPRELDNFLVEKADEINRQKKN